MLTQRHVQPANMSRITMGTGAELRTVSDSSTWVNCHSEAPRDPHRRGENVGRAWNTHLQSRRKCGGAGANMLIDGLGQR